MKLTRAIVDFSDYTAVALLPVARVIHKGLSAHAAEFLGPPMAMGDYLDLVDAYARALSARASNATSDVLALRAARAALEKALRKLGLYVNTVAEGDAALVDKSGFPHYTRGGSTESVPPAAPENLRLKHGTVSGTVIARHQPWRRSTTNEVQVTETNPNDETGWRTAGIFTGGRADLAGLTPGTLIFVRVRTVGVKGVMGAWSDPAQIRVL